MSRCKNQVALLFAAAAMIFVLAPNARAQAVAVAEVDGYVTDPSGQNIAGAQVKMIEVDKHHRPHHEYGRDG